jgi:hypothetical protein
MSSSIKQAVCLGVLLSLAVSLPALAQQDERAQRRERRQQDRMTRQERREQREQRGQQGDRMPMGQMNGQDPTVAFQANVQKATGTLNDMQSLFARIDQRKKDQAAAVGVNTTPAPGEAATAPQAAAPDAAR